MRIYCFSIYKKICNVCNLMQAYCFRFYFLLVTVIILGGMVFAGPLGKLGTTFDDRLCGHTRACGARRTCRIGSLQSLWYSWVNGSLQVTSSSVQQHSFFKVSAFNGFSRQYAAPNLCFCALHWHSKHSQDQVRMSSFGEELSKKPADDPRGAGAGLSWPMVPQVTQTIPAQQVLHQRCGLFQPSCEL